MSSTLEQQSAKRAAGRFDLETVARYRRAVDYLAAAQIYLKANPLLEEPLRTRHTEEIVRAYRRRIREHTVYAVERVDPPEISEWLSQRPSGS